MRVTAILPCWGRSQQTVTNVRRLLSTAGRVKWTLHAVTHEPDLAEALGDVDGVRVWSHTPVTYWQAMRLVHRETNDPLVIGLANDLLPSPRWLERGVLAYKRRFGGGQGLLGFNDGIHGPELSPHFLVHRDMVDRYGGWPSWYDHNFGDVEFCVRAQAEGLYHKDPWIVLYHDHWLTGAPTDTTYRKGGLRAKEDEKLFVERRSRGWRN